MKKVLHVTFSEDLIDAYNRIKMKAKPAKYIAGCVRFYEKYKDEVKGVSKQETPKISQGLSEDQVLNLFRKEFKRELDRLLSEGVLSLSSDKKVEPETFQVSGDIFGSPDTLSSVYAQEVSFVGAADMFDDD